MKRLTMILSTAFLAVTAGCAAPGASGRARVDDASPSSPADPQTVALLERACDGGNARSCLVAADHHRRGRGVPRNAKRAGVLNAKACDGGVAPACVRLGRPSPVRLVVTPNVPGGVSLAGIESVTIARVVGPSAERVRQAVKEEVGRASGSITTMSDETDVLANNELAITGVVVDHRHHFADGSSVTPPAPAPGAKTPPAPKRECRRTVLAVRFWFFGGPLGRRMPDVVVGGSSAHRSCDQAIDEAVEAIARELSGRLTRRFTATITLFRDPALPALAAGNKLARRGKWKLALGRYDAALTAAQTNDAPAPSVANVRYARAVALTHLGRYADAHAAATAAQKGHATAAFAAHLDRLHGVNAAAWKTPAPAQPPAETDSKSKKKGPKNRGLRRRVEREYSL